ncbi:MAG TPA: hypothetical protein VF502_12785 [Stellaceae bacterium]
MLRRVLPAVSILALAGCQQPYYAYPPSAAYYNGYYADRALMRGIAPLPQAMAPQPTAPPNNIVLAASRAGVPAGIGATPPALAGGSFREIDPREGRVGFSGADPIRKREAADYANRHVEWITLENGGVLVYEKLDVGAFAGPSDAALIRSDLDWSAFRQRGIAFDPAKLGKIGPFTYLAQSSPTYNCFLFRGKFGTPVDQQAYGNVCYVKRAKELDAVTAEMVGILSQVRFAGAAAMAVAAPAAPAPAPVAAAAKTLAEGSPAVVTMDQCRSRVSFSGAPVPQGAEYRYANGAYSEEAACTCRKDLDYSKVSEFDAVDNVRAAVEKSGFTFQVATFAETPELGRELAYEGIARQGPGDVFLVGRNFYQRCGLSVRATASSYPDLAKARQFVESVSAATAAPAEKVQEAAAGSTVSPVISRAEPSAETPPPAVPRQPVAAAALTGPAKAAVPAVQTAGDVLPGDATAMRLRRLQGLFEQKLITPGEYDAKRKSIIDSL